MNILITGANSFIGTYFRSNSKFDSISEVCLLENRPEEIEFKGVDVVMHLAAIVHQSKSIPEKEYYRINRDLCMDVAHAAKKAGVKQFVFFSTVKVFGESTTEGRPWHASSPCHPQDAYGKSKLEAEQQLQEIEDKDFVISIIRPAIVYGPGVKANLYNLIGLIKRMPIIPLGNISNKRSMASLPNLSLIIDAVIEKRSKGVFLAADVEPVSTSKLVKLISQSLSKRRVILPIPRFFQNILLWLKNDLALRLFGSLEIDVSDTYSRLEIKERLSINEGIAEMAKHYS